MGVRPYLNKRKTSTEQLRTKRWIEQAVQHFGHTCRPPDLTGNPCWVTQRITVHIIDHKLSSNSFRLEEDKKGEVLRQ